MWRKGNEEYTQSKISRTKKKMEMRCKWRFSKKLLLPDWAERRERAFNSTSSISTTRPNAPFLAQLTLPDYFNLQALVTEQQNKKEKKAQTEESPTNKTTRKRHACFRNTQDFGPKKKRNTQDLLTKRKETHKILTQINKKRHTRWIGQF